MRAAEKGREVAPRLQPKSSTRAANRTPDEKNPHDEHHGKATNGNDYPTVVNAMCEPVHGRIVASRDAGSKPGDAGVCIGAAENNRALSGLAGYRLWTHGGVSESVAARE